MATLTEFKTDRYHYFLDENGLLQGECTYWYGNGQLWEHCHYANDIRHGEYKRWHDNGQLWEHCYYVDDNLHGEYKLCYEDGALHAHCVYIANKKLDVDITNITNITHKDKFILHLKYGDFHWLP